MGCVDIQSWLAASVVLEFLFDQGWIYFALVLFYSLLSPYLCFISILYLDLYVLGDGAWISLVNFMQTKYLCLLIHILNKGEVGAMKPVKALQ